MKSYIKIDAIKVRDACDAYLQEREERIARRKAQFIQNMMQKRVSIFSSRKYTLDEAQKLWTQPGDLGWSPEDYERNKGGYFTDKAQNLLSLAQVAIQHCCDRTVFLDLEDASFLESYMK